ncbi:hypothetical protein LT330_003758 [Penicillium expansum]|nr:hypothetical protein LT330_003758 [Penicillium expansum]
MTEILTFRNLSLERHGNVFVLTMQKPPENRLNSSYCQEMIRAYRSIEKILGSDSEGAVITQGNDAKFWCTGLELDESDHNPFANTDGFYPLIHTILDFSFPTIALLTGHTFGGACPLALAHDYEWTGPEALDDGIVDAVAEPEEMLNVALELGAKWAPKAKMGVYALLRQELWGDAIRKFQRISYVHSRATSAPAKVKI